jgi:hypothetical protein
VEQAEGLREQRNAVKKAADGRIGANSIVGVVQTVCPISGLIVNVDGEGDHTSGRNYTAWKRLHETWERLEGVFAARRARHRGELQGAVHAGEVGSARGVAVEGGTVEGGTVEGGTVEGDGGRVAAEEEEGQVID